MNEITIVYLGKYLQHFTDETAFRTAWLRYGSDIVRSANSTNGEIKVELNITIEKPEATITPYPIDGPGWYRMANKERVVIEYLSGTGYWIGRIHPTGKEQAWHHSGREVDGYTPWTIVAKED